jgi:hypothetical protein
MWTDKDREKYKSDGRRYPSDLTDTEWSIIEPLFRGYFTFTADMREVPVFTWSIRAASGERCRATSVRTRRCAPGMTGSGQTVSGLRPAPI